MTEKTQTNPESAAAAEPSPAERVFGKVEPLTDQTGNTGESPSGDKPDSQSAKGEPPQSAQKAEGAAPASGDAKPAESQPSPRYAGRYETPEALEAAFKQQQAKMTELATRDKQFREQIATMESQLKELVAKPKPGLGTEDSLKMLSGDADFQAMRELLEENFGREEADKFIRGLSTLLTQPAGKPDAALTDRLTRLEASQVERDFYVQYPEAKDEKIQSAMDQVAQEIKDKGEDPVFQHWLIYQLAVARSLPEMIDAAVVNRVKTMSEEEKAKLLAGNLVSGTVSGGAAPAPDVPTMRDKQKQVFGDI